MSTTNALGNRSVGSLLGPIFVPLFLASCCFAQAPNGKFQCRHFPGFDGRYSQPVAYIWMDPNGAYVLLDLTSKRGKSSGSYVFDQKQQVINWTSGDLSKLLGHYFANISGRAVIMLNTKKDPEGHVDGTLPCLRVADR